MESESRTIPRSLRRWFLIHFIVDIIFALPLLVIPEILLSLLNWPVIDPVMSRLVGAALLGIGTESLLGRNAGYETFKAMLNLKILWASGAVLGIGMGIARGGPSAAWIFLGIFTCFLGLWSYYRITLK